MPLPNPILPPPRHAADTMLHDLIIAILVATTRLQSAYRIWDGNWQIGSISEERAGKGWFWSLGVGTPFDPDKVKMHGSHVDSLDKAKRQIPSSVGQVVGMGRPCRATTRRVKHSPYAASLQGREIGTVPVFNS